MFVGAVMPRQKTAFASDERKTNPPAKQAMAVQINRKRRICFVRCDIKDADATLSSRSSQGAEISDKCLSDAITREMNRFLRPGRRTYVARWRAKGAD
jgi:hypothetical protein